MFFNVLTMKEWSNVSYILHFSIKLDYRLQSIAYTVVLVMLLLLLLQLFLYETCFKQMYAFII